MKRREVKSEGEKERYKHLNAEFQRIARRDKKVFLSDQYKEREGNNRMGKTKHLFKKVIDQGNISWKDGLNKGQKWYGPNRSRRYKEEVARILEWVTLSFSRDLPNPGIKLGSPAL